MSTVVAKRRIRWSMLLSHHAPCDYDRTLELFGLRICSRCLGVLAGAYSGLFVAQLALGVSLLAQATLGLALTLPAGFDFAAHELIGAYRSTNLRRVLSGFALGLALGIGIDEAVHATLAPILCVLLFLALLQFAIAFCFRLANHLDNYLKRYEDAVFVASPNDELRTDPARAREPDTEQ